MAKAKIELERTVAEKDGKMHSLRAEVANMTSALRDERTKNETQSKAKGEIEAALEEQRVQYAEMKGCLTSVGKKISAVRTENDDLHVKVCVCLLSLSLVFVIVFAIVFVKPSAPKRTARLLS